MAKIVKFEDRPMVNIKMSLNEIKMILEKMLRHNKIDSPEGILRERMVKHLRDFIERRSEKYGGVDTVINTTQE